MMKLLIRWMPVVILAVGLLACSSNDTILLKDAQNQKGVSIIALMPVANLTKDDRAPHLLQTKIAESLRFKGYPQIHPAAVNGESKPVGPKETAGNQSVVAQPFSGIPGADAALYCTLEESRAQAAIFYAPATVSVRCELRSVRTGETLWQARHKSTSRSFDLLQKRLKMKCEGALEEALEEVVGKVMETLPYGPKLRG
jgi:hypothetical protein